MTVASCRERYRPLGAPVDVGYGPPRPHVDARTAAPHVPAQRRALRPLRPPAARRLPGALDVRPLRPLAHRRAFRALPALAGGVVPGLRGKPAGYHAHEIRYVSVV